MTDSPKSSPSDIPDGVPEVSFTDPRINMGYWYPKIKDLDVPTPQTRSLELEQSDEGGQPEWDTVRATEIVDALGGEAFVRSGYASARLDVEEGGHIRSTDAEHIDGTLAELLFQHIMMSMPLGGKLWFREWLDLNFCSYCPSSVHPEIRVFIRDGEVTCYHPRLEGFDKASNDHYETAVEYIDSGWTGSHRDTTLKEYATRVADAIGGNWSVDFVLDRDGEWHLTDMALNAVYDLSERDDNMCGWSNISEHPSECEHDLMSEVEASTEK